jgi:hypothetical protein
VVVDGELVGEPGLGTFVARETPDWSQYPVFVTQVLRTGGYVVGTREVGACSRQDRTPSTARVQRSRWSTIGVGDILQGDVELKEEIHRRPAAAVGLDTFTVKNMIGARTFVIHVYFLRRSNVTESPPDFAPGSSPSADRSDTPVGNLEMLARRSFATPVSRSQVRVSSSPPAPTRTAQLEHNRR